jgi:hypothetical protein
LFAADTRREGVNMAAQLRFLPSFIDLKLSSENLSQHELLPSRRLVSSRQALKKRGINRV